MKLIERKLGRRVIESFLAENPPDSIRILLLMDGRGSVYDVDPGSDDGRERPVREVIRSSSVPPLRRLGYDERGLAGERRVLELAELLPEARRVILRV
jgi:hypothetical protein